MPRASALAIRGDRILYVGDEPGARALANDPPFILGDEPTANLDSKTGQVMMALFSDLVRENGRSVVIVTHDNRIRDIADRVLYLEDGRLYDQERQGSRE